MTDLGFKVTACDKRDNPYSLRGGGEVSVDHVCIDFVSREVFCYASEISPSSNYFQTFPHIASFRLPYGLKPGKINSLMRSHEFQSVALKTYKSVGHGTPPDNFSNVEWLRVAELVKNFSIENQFIKIPFNGIKTLPEKVYVDDLLENIPLATESPMALTGIAQKLRERIDYFGVLVEITSVEDAIQDWLQNIFHTEQLSIRGSVFDLSERTFSLQEDILVSKKINPTDMDDINGRTALLDLYAYFSSEDRSYTIFDLIKAVDGAEVISFASYQKRKK